MGRHFSQQQVEEMRDSLATLAVKDSEFNEIETISDSDKMAIVHSGNNAQISVQKFKYSIEDDLEKEGITGKIGEIDVDGTALPIVERKVNIPMASNVAKGVVLVDDELSAESSNPPQNKKVTEELNKKANASALSDVAFSGDYNDLDNLPPRGDQNVVAWDGESEPDVSKIPFGVTVVYNETDYTGTLVASSDTANDVYLVASTTQEGDFDRYITSVNGSSYSWVPMGSTQIQSPVIADDFKTNDPTKALSAAKGVILKGTLDQIALGSTDNVADMYSSLIGVTGLTYDGNGGFYGIIGSGGFRDKSIPVTCDSGQYTLSFEAYCEGNNTTSGNGLQVKIVYSDATSEAKAVPNNTSEYTLFSKTSNTNKQISSIGFGYVSGSSNIVHIRKLQLRKGDEVLPYESPKCALDYGARESLATKEDLSNKVTSLSPTPSVSKYPCEKLMYDTAIKPIEDMTMPKSTNVYDYSTVGVVSGYIRKEDGVLTVSDSYPAFSTGLIPVKPNHYYYLSNNLGTKGIRCLKSDGTTKVKVLAPSTGTEYATYWYLPNADGTDSVQNGQFKTPADAAYVQITVTPLGTTSIGNYYKIMLEDVGDTYNSGFVPSEYAPYSTERVIKDSSLQYPVSQQEDTKTIKILCVGNSFTLDSMGYVPFLLTNIVPNAKLTLGVAFISGSPLVQHTAYFTGESLQQGTTTYYTESGAYKKNTNGTVTTVTYTYYKSSNGAPWTTTSNAKVSDFVNDEDWDIVTFQQASAQSWKEWATYFSPYIFKLQKSLSDKLSNHYKLGWILTHGASGETDQDFYDKWEGTAENAKNVMDKTGASVLFSYGTSVQNLRTTSLKSLGDGSHHNLTVDDAHLQDGIGCLCAAYSNTTVILDLLSEHNKSVVGDDIRPDATWLTQHSVPGTSLGTSGVIGISDANCFLAQMSAVKGVMNPYKVTDISPYES